MGTGACSDKPAKRPNRIPCTPQLHNANHHNRNQQERVMRKRNSVATTTTNNEIPRPEATHILTTFSSHPDKERLLGKRPIRVAALLPVCLPAYYSYASLTYTRTRCRTRCRLTPYASLACCSYASLASTISTASATRYLMRVRRDIHCESDLISTAQPVR